MMTHKNTIQKIAAPLLGAGLLHSLTTRQGLKSVANSKSRLKPTQKLINSPRLRSLAMKQGFQPVSDLEKMNQLGSLGDKVSQSGEAGYTILESIVAMVVVAVLMTAVAPVIVFSGATRLQARRVELATQAGRSYIDWVRADPVTRAPAQTVNLGAGVTNFPAPTNATTGTPGVPATGDLAGNCTSQNDYCTNNTLYCVNFDDIAGCQSTSLRDMVVQGFRSAPSAGANANQGYLLGVRVYRANSFQSGIAFKVVMPATNVTNALGDRGAPLVIMTTDISPNNSTQGYQNYCARLNASGGCN